MGTHSTSSSTCDMASHSGFFMRLCILHYDKPKVGEEHKQINKTYYNK